MASGKAKIFYSDPDLIVSAHDKEIKLSDPEVSFTLPWSNLQLLIQASASQSIEDLCLYGNDGVSSWDGHLTKRDAGGSNPPLNIAFQGDRHPTT